MNKPENYILDEWENIVANAKMELNDNHPLMQDFVIVEIDKYLKQLEKPKKSPIQYTPAATQWPRHTRFGCLFARCYF